MRLSIYPNDPGYAAFRAMRARGLVPVISVNGEAVNGCVTADTKRGSVTMFERDNQGRVQLNAKRDAPRRKRLSGKVGITVRKHEAWNG